MTTYDKIIATWNKFLQEFPEAIDLEEFDLLKEVAYIKKVGSQFCVFSEEGKRMGCYSSKKQAEERLRMVEIFKHMKEKSEEEFAKQYCFCTDCDREFFVRTMCHLERCPYCNSDDLEEITGEL